MKKLLYPGILVVLSFTSFACKPGGGIGIYNDTDYNLIVECKTIYDDIMDTSNYDGDITIKNSAVIKKNAYKSLINIYTENDVLEELGFGTKSSDDDIINSIRKIFYEINVYKIIDRENILYYDISFFLKKENINYSKTRGSNFIVYTVK
jgi:hypothetical protein